ncbi:sigma-70 family RNA polymerase sigma factor [Saccharothrix luteola]|uniref:sigma-70 family RNA polymerase sigma factor n=1 Tax=Saccharothrix luteola TaxID=2893018 RepID=UPI001E299A11|nr:sigma-70 family RNA polymerase sigma factor [Saccharothrix luteola]MCC8248734.1 sigma-70 family RNA polymerase sigma factor [Saccharothrix luteola]
MATVPAEVQGPSDAELIDSVRAGDIEAYGQLYERHVSAAYNLARQLARSSAESDDLVSDAFAKVLDTLRAGRGPDSAFRAYLLTALRHTAYDKTRRDRKLELADDVAEVAPEATSVPFKDTAVAGLERSMAARAFARLPERWQTVLWHTEIEGQSPAEVAPLLGLTANGVSALAYRAREGLKQAYLQVHLAETETERCRATVERLGAWTRGGLSKRETTQVEAHLDECTGSCRALAAELADVNGALRGIIAPLVLGLGASGYLAAAGAGTAKAVTVAAAAGTGGAAGAVASAPRQFLVAGVSAAALVVAVAIGLASGGEQEVPAAQAAPVVTTQPTEPAQPTPPPPPPPAAVPSPEPSPTTEPPPAPAPTTPPTTPPPTTTPPTEPEPEPEPRPTPPNLVPVVPSGFVLTPGEEPVDLPITVRNSGESASEPASAAVVLPPGVRSTGPAASFAGGGLVRLDGAADQTVACPAGTGAVTCSTTQGIAPGGSATFVFRVLADPEAATGRITGTVTAGTSVSVAIAVDVEVRPVHDDLELLVHKWQHGFWDPRLDVKATNTGGRAGDLRLVVESDGHITLVALWPGCERSRNRVVCEVPLARGASFRLAVWAIGSPHRDGVVRVSATLGTAAEQVEVPISLRPGEPHEPGPPAGTPTKTTAPTTTRTTPPTTTTTTTRSTTPTTTNPTTTVPSTPTTQPPASTTTTTEPTTPPTTTTTTPPPTRGEPCRPRPPWLPPGWDDPFPGHCRTPS